MTEAARLGRTPTGRPLLALAGLVTCWIGARAAIWELPEPFAEAEGNPARLLEQVAIPGLSAAAQAMVRPPGLESRSSPTALARITLAKSVVRTHAARNTALSTSAAAIDLSSASGSGEFSLGSAAPRPQSVAEAPATRTVAVEPSSGPARPRPAGRWSADLWLALREGGGALFAGGATAPVYGASQAGAVLRYRLAPASPHEPAAYARAVHALDRRESDLAAGWAARVVPRLPLTAHLEARVSQRGGSVVLRPAAFLSAGVDKAPLPLGFHARGYTQAGYVGGRDATAFADGSFVAERAIMGDAKASFSAGSGMWGGAQRGSARLDIGPSASARFSLGNGIVRVAVDYRYRVAGNAVPASGAALTLSAGF